MENVATIIAGDGHIYELVDDCPGLYTRVDESGARLFAEKLPGQEEEPPQGIYGLHPREEMLAQPALKTEIDYQEFTNPGVKVSRASFQAYKKHNEDRSFVHQFDEGMLFGVLDEYTAKTLAPLLASAIILELQTSPPEMAIPSALTRAIIEYDESILADVLPNFDLESKPAAEWDAWDVYPVFGFKKDEGLPGNRYEIPRRAVAGATALTGYLSKNGKDLWIANLGDSEAFVGSLSDDKESWNVTMLNDIHTARNPAEVARLKEEHPGEEVIKHDRALGFLSVTRALGDFQLKVNVDIGYHILAFAGKPSPVIPMAFDHWRTHHKTPPYLSSTPSIRYHSRALGADELLVLATDGVANIGALVDYTAQEQAALVLSLASAHNAAQPTEPWSSLLKHRFISPDKGDNAAERTIRNLLFGLDDHKLAREIRMEFPDAEKWGLQDDITVLVLEACRASS